MQYIVQNSKEMRPSSLVLLALLSNLVLSSSSPSWGATESDDAFLECLLHNSNTSYPISNVIYTPDNSSYSITLQNYIRNLRYNTTTTPKPVLIITATHESHIQISIFCSRKVGLQMKIRSGGHDYEGISYWSEHKFFMLDMFNLRTVDVDIATETSWVQVGATIGEVYYGIANKSRTHGFPSGICPTVGVGGQISGGGYGNMLRKYGLSADHIIDAKMVDVNGRLLDRASMGEDLFWAITGGGAASFGVVVAYRINLVSVPENVTVFKVKRTLEQNATDIVYKWQQVAPVIDDNLFIRLITQAINTSSGRKTVQATFVALYLGSSDSLLSLTSSSFPELGLQSSDCKEMSWIDSVLYWAFPIRKPVEALLSRSSNVRYLKRKSDYLKEPIPKEGLERIWKLMMKLQTPNLNLTFNPYGGKMAEISPAAKPFPHRAGNLAKLQYANDWDEAGTEISKQNVQKTRKLYDAMTPYVSKNPREAFLNYRDLDLGINHNGKSSYVEGRAYGIKYFLSNFDRLVKIKTKVDPGNFFRNEQSVPTYP